MLPSHGYVLSAQMSSAVTTGIFSMKVWDRPEASRNWHSTNPGLWSSVNRVVSISKQNLVTENYAFGNMSQARQNSCICGGVPNEMRAYVSRGGKGRPMAMLFFRK